MVPWFKTLSKKLLAKSKNVNDPGQPHIDNISLDNLDARTLKPIVEVVLQSDEFMVTIDKSLSVNWMTNGGYKGYAKEFGTVTSIVQMLSAQIDQLFANKANRYKYKRMIADALALALDEKEAGNALVILKQAENKIKDYGKERIRIAYIFYASLTTCLIAILTGIFVHYKNSDWLFGANNILYRICITTLMGGIGAFVSTFIRFKNYEGNIVAGLSAHRLDGFLRIAYGCIAALILGLAIYSNTVFGFLNTPTNQWVIYLLATIAGASEFLVTNIVRNAKTKEESGAVSISLEKEGKYDIVKSNRTEKNISHKNINIGEDNDNETFYSKNGEEDRMEEEAGYENISEEIRMINKNKKNEVEHETLDQQISKLDGIWEEDVNINESAKEMTMIDNKTREHDDNKTSHQENQKPNKKSQEDFKITEQLVQGKMDLQDY